MSVTRAAVVRIIPAIEMALSTADRVTLAGSMMPCCWRLATSSSLTSLPVLLGRVRLAGARLTLRESGGLDAGIVSCVAQATFDIVVPEWPVAAFGGSFAPSAGGRPTLERRQKAASLGEGATFAESGQA
jgi:hypothetical protein